MRAFITCAMLTVTALTVNATPAFAQHGRFEGLIDSMYMRYLHRPADSAALYDHARALRHGTPIDVVEAAILASPEYYQRSGNTPEGFVAALYRDVLGRRATGHEFGRTVDVMLTHGRQAAAQRVLNQRVVAPTVVVASQPAPVVVTRPYVAPPTVIVPAPRPIHTAPSVYIAPPPVSFRINFGR